MTNPVAASSRTSNPRQPWRRGIRRARWPRPWQRLGREAEQRDRRRPARRRRARAARGAASRRPPVDIRTWCSTVGSCRSHGHAAFPDDAWSASRRHSSAGGRRARPQHGGTSVTSVAPSCTARIRRSRAGRLATWTFCAVDVRKRETQVRNRPAQRLATRTSRVPCRHRP